MTEISDPRALANQINLFHEGDKIIFFGSQSESLSDFYDLAKELSLQPICIDNLDKVIFKSKHNSLHYKTLKSFHFLLPTIISVVSPKEKYKAANHAIELGFLNFPAFISPTADISKSAKIAKGGFINSSAIVGSNVIISDFVTINKGANISHDVAIGKFTHIAPSACVLGSVNIGSNVTIGANATILPKLYVGDEAVVGAGSVVTNDVPAGSVVYGNPARLI